MLCLIFSCGLARAEKSIVFTSGTFLKKPSGRTAQAILKEAFKRNGFTFEVEHMPAMRSLETSNSGLSDGELSRVGDFHSVSNGAYPNLIRIDSVLYTNGLSAFALKGVDVSSWTDLSNLPFAYRRGRKNLENNIVKLNLVETAYPVTSDLQAFRMLSSGRVKVVVSSTYTGSDIIKNGTEFVDVDEVAILSTVSMHAYIHEKHRKLAPQLSKTIDAMKRDGSFQRVVAEVDGIPYTAALTTSEGE